MPRLKRALRFFCCLRAAEVEEEDPEYIEMLERARIHQQTWRQRELARFIIEMDNKRELCQKAVQPTPDLVHDKADRGEGVEMTDLAKERARALYQQARYDEGVERLMEIRRQNLRRTLKMEKIRKELAAVLVLETKISIGTVLINLGANGASNYIIWKGPSNVISNCQGRITTLKEKNNIGNLALTNKSPQDASVIMPREHDCHFLRVGKMNIASILMNVHAATVNVQDNGSPALILQRSSEPTALQPASCSNKYLVKSGTPDKILEFMLFSIKLDTPDDQMDSFLLTHHLFLPTEEMCSALQKYIHAEPSEGSRLVNATDFSLRERVVKLVGQWVALYGHLLMDNPVVVRFLEKLARQVKGHAHLRMVRDYISQRRYILLNKGYLLSVKRCGQNHKALANDNLIRAVQPIRANDKVLLKVFRQDHSCVSLMMPLNASAGHVMLALKASADKVLVKMKSSGMREQLEVCDRPVSFLTLNERLFLCPASQTGNLTPLRGQLGPERRNSSLDDLSAKAIAAQLTSYDWELFHAMHETELLYYVLGKRKFPYSTTANLERLVRRFNLVMYWVATELCLCKELSKRAGLISKFIEIATHLYRQQNMSSFVAVIYGLTNRVITRLHRTWERVPSAVMETFSEYVHMLVPYNNCAALREVLATLNPPYVPYVHLIVDDLTSIHEGNQTLNEGLVNFDKMNMIAKMLKMVRGCRSQPYVPLSPQHGLKSTESQRKKHTSGNQSKQKCDFRNLKVIDDKNRLMNLSTVIEP